jgi:CO/xanthine dehydrogenase FAD-binding subunit
MRGYLPDYELVAPDSVQGVLDLLAEQPATWRPLAGGTDVMVELAAGSLPPGKFVSIWHLDELRGIVADDAWVTLGALTTYSDVRDHALLQAEYPMLVSAARQSGAIAIQNRGTLGGNVVNASPAADSPPALLAYEAQIELRSVRGRRFVDYRTFHTGYKQMQRASDELVTAIRMPRAPGGAGALHDYRKVGTRKAQAISKVCLAALGRLDGGRVAHFRAAIGSVAPVVLDLRQTEAAVVGQTLDAALIERAADVAAGEVTPIDDVRSTAQYRTVVSRNLVRDFLAALARGQTGVRPSD